jgi:hypothetical protein
MNAETYFRMQMLGFKSRQANFRHTPSAMGALIYCLSHRDIEAARIICKANGWIEPEPMKRIENEKRRAA